MDFQVSARKWRPQKFNELIGQEHIVRTLTNAIQLERVSHAYLFSGTRGVGKTTTARILSKALNCENGPTSDPCDNCSFCVEIREGTNVDVQEIDGASNNGVAEVREIIEKIRYATSSCRFKVYIIDEIHMLSKNAFNALLKTLEEPPPNVIFIFATTELIKIPETVLSRCQCFKFKPLSHRQIIKQLRLITEREGIAIEALSLEEIAKNGAGSMRDAQSLLDQVIAYCGKEVGAGSVEAVLGIVSRNVLETFVGSLAERDCQALIKFVQDIVLEGKDLNYFCRDLAEYFRHLLMIKILKNPETVIDVHTLNLDVLKKQAESFHEDELQQMFSVLSKAETDMKRSSLMQSIFEMAVFRLCDVRPFKKIGKMIEKINKLENSIPTDSGNKPLSRVQPQAVPAQQANLETAPSAEEHGFSGTDIDWENIKARLYKKKPVFTPYLSGCRILRFDDSVLSLGLSDALTKEMVEREDNANCIREAVKDITGREVSLEFSVSGKKEDGENLPEVQEEKKNPQDYNKGRQKSESEIIQKALEVFGGVVIR